MNNPSDAKIATLRDMLVSGQKIQAIKFYREQTGLTLRESKDAVEAMEAAMRSGAPISLPATLEQAATRNFSSGYNPDSLQELLFSGQKIHAIKLYRESSGVGLKEAKEAVEVIEANLRREQPERFQAATGSGCYPTVIALGFCILASLYCLIGA